ncbi:MAG: DUF192 domain-containing protein [Patescibacteria group bacterium]|nr:DUF192 domain-containing protein [Patescibacteria group bacterium]
MNSKKNLKDIKPLAFALLLLIFIVSIVFLTQIRRKSASSSENSLQILTADKIVELSVELAQTPEEWRDGLMYRTEICENCGMLFIFPDETARSFWMKNTLISLDVLFITSDGKIANIAAETAPNQTDTTYKSTEKVKYVLEVNGGWCKQNAVEAGDSVDFSDVLSDN